MIHAINLFYPWCCFLFVFFFIFPNFGSSQKHVNLRESSTHPHRLPFPAEWAKEEEEVARKAKVETFCSAVLEALRRTEMPWHRDPALVLKMQQANIRGLLLRKHQGPLKSLMWRTVGNEDTHKKNLPVARLLIMALDVQDLLLFVCIYLFVCFVFSLSK